MNLLRGGSLTLAMGLLWLSGSCSVGKDPQPEGSGSVLLNPRLQMIVTRIRVEPVFMVGDADDVPSELYNHVLFLSLPGGAQFSGGGGGTTQGNKSVDRYGWSGGTITIDCDYSKKCGNVDGQRFDLAGGNVLLVSLDAKGAPSFLGQWTDITPYPSLKADGSPNYSASTDFLDALRQKHSAVRDFIQANGGLSSESRSSPEAVNH